MPVADTAVAPARFAGQTLNPFRPASLPFMIVGKVNGQERAARAATPAEAMTHMLHWLRLDEDAAAVWYLREDWPTTITLVGRPAPGVVGETRRSAHLFSFRPAVVHYGSIVAHCGTELSLLDIEWIELGTGMPCECCLALSAPAQPHLEGR